MQYESTVKFYLGIDAGGTKTEFLLCDKEKNVMAHTILGPANPNDVGIEQCKDILNKGILECCRGINYKSVALYAGIAGGMSGENQKELHDFLTKYSFGTFRNGNDLESAVEVALHGKDGIVLITGTGIIGLAVHEDNQKRIGGWGYLIDNGGSGYNLGRDALEAVLSSLDGRGKETILTTMIEEKLGCSVVLAIPEIYRKGKAFIAELAPIVFDAFEQGDKVAETILLHNVEEIARIIRAGIKFIGNTDVPVVICGGLVRRAELWIDLLRKKMSERVEIIVLTEPIVNGAVRLAEQEANLEKASRIKKQRL